MAYIGNKPSEVLPDQLGLIDGTVASPALYNTDDLNTGILFPAEDTMAIATGGTERMRVDSAGNVGIGVSPSTRNNTRLQIVDGIGFPATQVASSDPNTLDDYEEGTWTPILAGTTGGAKTPYAGNFGWYTKCGRIVTVGGTLAYSGGDSLSGSVVITGLPFAAAISSGAQRSAGSVGAISGSLSFSSSVYTYFTLVIDAGKSYVYTLEVGSGTYSHNPVVASGGYLYGFQLTYLTGE